MNREVQAVVYWDASAVLSALFKDSRSGEAMKWSQKDAVHLISTLSYAEVCSVITRLKKEKILADVLVNAALEVLEGGPWRRLYISPEWAEVKALSRKWTLRGADLWHLAIGKTIQKQIPELTLLTFDKRLQIAAKKEHLIR